jgi:2,5-furandicarboxylate decarboxylase 1
MGIDATISDDVPRERYERIAYAYADSVSLAEVVKKGSGKPPAEGVDSDGLSERIRKAIEAQPLYFAELTEKFEAEGFQAVARAVGALHESGALWQDPVGKFCLKGSDFAAKPPPKK